MKNGTGGHWKRNMTLALLLVIVGSLAGCASPANDVGSTDHVRSSRVFENDPTLTAQRTALPTRAFTATAFSQTRQWLRDHPHDPRTTALRAALGDKPDTLWLTGDSRDLPNLTSMLATARSTGTTPVVVLYNIPGRDDGLTGPINNLTSTDYLTWVGGVASAIGNTSAIVIVEPDSLWLAYRQLRADRAGFDRRIQLLQKVVTRLNRNPGTYVYLDAGTSSGSVTPERMAALLRGAGASERTGFAVNVSSFAPTAPITIYAQRIRAALIATGTPDPRYVVDTSRNGNPQWDNDTWCNPPGRKIGYAPRANPPAAPPGLDAYLWVKAPGTSDGSCGVGQGSSGGDFLPAVAFAMTR